MADESGSKRRRKPARRKPGEGTYHQLDNGTWRYRGVVGQAPNGTAIRKDFYGRTKADALTKFQAYCAAHPSGPPPLASTVSLETYLVTWLDHIIRPTRAISTLELYTFTAEKHIVPTLGSTRLCDLTRLQIQSWIYAMEPSRAQHNAYDVLHSALNEAVANDLLTTNPANGVKLPTYEQRTPIALTMAQARALVAAAEGELDLREPIQRRNGRSMTPIAINPRYGALFRLLVTVGCRRGEALAARWSDLDLSAGTWAIRRSLDRERRERTTKTPASQRTVTLDPGLIEALKRHRQRMQQEPHREGWKPDGLVFPSETGTPLAPRNLHRIYVQIKAAAKLPSALTIHDLRHTAGSLMLQDGAHLATVSRVLGHSSVAVTASIYAHGYEEDAAEAIKRLGKRLGD
jgi:integrase